ncbi:hypothetical protein A9Q81_11155 [Gammaproteobacteria bacterium 42_54_T18]|nr:hypothetical protein A9Q81_11155 [Gammaproteobacteria bacterium 42_54_T18]
MSYILDALKKSEEERKKGDVPGLQTYTPTAEASSGNKTWVIGVIVLVATNIIGLLIWAPWQATSTLVKENVLPNVQVGLPPTPIRQAAPQQQVLTAPVTKPATVKPTIKPIVKAVVRPKVKPTAKPVVNPIAKLQSTYREEPAPQEEYRSKMTPSTAYLPQLSELPQSIQTQIPDLTFSSHMYSSQDRFRSITINGKRLKQGRYYNEHLYVNEITEKGAIMGFEGTLFEVDVLGQWGD